MTTPIDRIIESMRKCFGIHYINSKEENILKDILEAELTAVKGVDELISLVDERKKIIDDGIVPTDRIIGYQNCVDGLEKIIKALKQTSVTKEDVGEMGKHIMLQPGEYYKDEFGNIITYEDEQKERLKDSQPKEVLLGEDTLYKEDLGCRIYGYVNDGKVNITRVEYTGTRGIG